MKVIRKPGWIKVKAPVGGKYDELKSLLKSLKVNTICVEAVCPNIGRCWEHKIATFLILGDICTRGCKFCAVKRGKPLPPSPEEPKAVAEAVKILGIRHVVLTSVTRDDLEDGGAGQFAKAIEEIKERIPECRVEVLVPDFSGRRKPLEMVLKAGPTVLGHNMETVRRLYPVARAGADYMRSLELLRRAKEISPNTITKSGIMVGLGESLGEIKETLKDIRDTGCDILTIGQYLSPSPKNLPVARYYTPEEFEFLKKIGEGIGFSCVFSGPFVRSSYMADLMISELF